MSTYLVFDGVLNMIIYTFAIADHFIQFSYGGGGSKVRQDILHLIWFATI